MRCGEVKRAKREKRLTRLQSRGSLDAHGSPAKAERRRCRVSAERRSSVCSIFGILAALSLAETTAAIDVPIDAELLRLRYTQSGTAVTFLSRDPDVPF